MAEKEQEKTKKPVYTVIYNKDDRLWHITKSGAKRVIAKRVTKGLHVWFFLTVGMVIVKMTSV